MVHHERFHRIPPARRAAETLVKHAQAAEQQYLHALALCPLQPSPTSAPSTTSWAVSTTRRPDRASPGALREDPQICEQTGDRYGAGPNPLNMAVMYLQAAERESTPARQRDLLLRAQAYAQAALRDFQHYQGRAADDEADAQQLLAHIAQALGELPS